MSERNHVPVALGGKIILISNSQWLELREKLKGCRTVRDKGEVAQVYLRDQGLIE